MSKRTLTSFLVSLLLAAVPASALADGGAGDNQYQDPLAAPPAAKKPKKKAATAPAATTAPVASPAPAPATSTVAGSSVSGTPAAATELPRTGFPAGVVGLGGVALIGMGAALRRRTVTQ